MRKSIFYRATGRTITDPSEAATLKADEIVRDNQVLAPEEMRSVSQKQSVYKNGRLEEGIDSRLNAVGDVADTATGYQIAIDTLTYIKKQVTDQKFYQVAPADYLPVVVGDGAFSQQILTNLSFSNADDFESGNLKTGADDAHLTNVDVAVTGVIATVVNWGKTLGYTIFDVEQALRANNWDIIEKKHRSRKINWDLGIQKIAFLGSASDSRVPGLLTNPNINTNTSLITKYISSMSASELQTFVAGLIKTYFANTASTAMPNRFVIPYADWTGMPQLTQGTVGTYPVPLIKYLQEAFSMAVQPYEKEFKIMPLAYCDAANNSAALNYYMLYRDDPESIRMDIPVPYTTTQPNSLNNFSFQDVGYGQYTGTNVYRNLETLRFTWS